MQTAIGSIELPATGGNAAQYAAGRDGWASADGTILARVASSTYGEIWITAKPSNVNDYIYKDGFGG